MRPGSDLRGSSIHTGIRLQKDLDDCLSINGCRLDVLNVAHRCCEETLEYRRNSALHLFGVQSRVSESHCNHWDVNVGEDIGWSAENHDRAEDENQ